MSTAVCRLAALAYAKAGFREDPDAYGPFAYSATNLVMDAIEKTGPDRKKMKEVLNPTRPSRCSIGPPTSSSSS